MKVHIIAFEISFIKVHTMYSQYDSKLFFLKAESMPWLIH